MLINNAFASDPASPLIGLLDRARTGTLPLVDLFKITESFNATGQRAQAAEFFKTWIAYNDTSPLLHIAYFNYGVTLGQMGDTAGAVQALRACIKANPRFGAGYINLGRALEDSGLPGQAIQQWRDFVEETSDITPERIGHRLMSLQHIGRVLEGAGRLEEAEAALWQAIELQPDRTEAGQHWTAARQRQCKWPVLAPSEHVTYRQLLDSMSPLTLAFHADDPMFQLAKAYRFSKAQAGRPDLSAFPRKQPKKKVGTGERLRVGYVSSDFREHAVGFALSEAFELHDKTSVEIFAYYSGAIRPNDETQGRIRAAVDCWRDITALSDVDAAKLISADEIDILIDLNGYTKNARTKIFVYRPAPVIVNFCGFPGSMASAAHQYIIADGHIIPPEQEIYFTEKVLRLSCYLAIDRTRQLTTPPSRAESGLPEDAFVYACFNGMQKINANCFGRWMQILSATPGSVLWLRSGDAVAQDRLCKLAAQSGVDANRLIFATPVADHSGHIARMALADLFLDTSPYGAHATATDALSAGLPVLTISGAGFAPRVCTSIVAAAGIPELICTTPDEYVQRAIAFERDRESLAAVRTSLENQRTTSVLQDTPAFVRRLEELFWQMQGERERGETPLPDFTNLDVYYEVGAELLQQHVEFEDEETYRKRYIAALAKLHDYSPLPYDKRLWRDPAA
tara:strand:+ start:71810 stop:73858 length:2049 start_codon:yes stop_codon:yes gene_type:complete